MDDIDIRIKELNRQMAIQLVRHAMTDYFQQVMKQNGTDSTEIATVTVDKVIKALEWKP